ncbi:hypothetical protein QTO34_018454 [Cnephaeus nilssonii]|uniref:Uncharacterized protein n=1 Tax=Cnephaeus nilssonii TaxID=3371016 RepID=A0AA40HYV1_CNENI|nr:hypothetical protein QTO34_018454 [Eptesicus nilssonii]
MCLLSQRAEGTGHHHLWLSAPPSLWRGLRVHTSRREVSALCAGLRRLGLPAISKPRRAHPGAMEEEAVGCNALPSQGALLTVPSALCAPQGPPPAPPANQVHRYRIRVSLGGCKCPVPKGAMASLSITLVKILHKNSSRLSTLIYSIRLSEEILTPSGSPNQSKSTGRWRADICGHKSCGLGKGHKSRNTIGGSHLAPWRRRNTHQLHLQEPAGARGDPAIRGKQCPITPLLLPLLAVQASAGPGYLSLGPALGSWAADIQGLPEGQAVPDSTRRVQSTMGDRQARQAVPDATRGVQATIGVGQAWWGCAWKPPTGSR